MELEYDVDKLLNDIKQKDVKSIEEIEEITQNPKTPQQREKNVKFQ